MPGIARSGAPDERCNRCPIQHIHQKRRPVEYPVDLEHRRHKPVNHVTAKQTNQFGNGWRQKRPHQGAGNQVVVLLAVCLRNALRILIFADHRHHDVEFNSVVGGAVVVYGRLPALLGIDSIVFFGVCPLHDFQKERPVRFFLNIGDHVLVRQIQLCTKDKARIPRVWCKRSPHHEIIAAINELRPRKARKAHQQRTDDRAQNAPASPKGKNHHDKQNHQRDQHMFADTDECHRPDDRARHTAQLLPLAAVIQDAQQTQKIENPQRIAQPFRLNAVKIAVPALGDKAV